ncbi:hypothetical protein Daura_49740 [Dactylosporangium aurantiacum]|uniref:Uncharacterized protein n=1 Tax=Dactylosporangium aurantiacum TaxID=35754 RepID=A0A9Q9IDQ0_9ACTN|nr:hypothetical protein [Dactylosporangium aurantiacum]MDG6107440.1 hypothetical protein [Dactylosporangium aurantiacum]UWZ54434.1 hypothetical protein Daura_49740 [Dactylosporangium aurantiacum]
MAEERRGVVLYGTGVEAVAGALWKLDPRYVPAGAEVSAGQVPVLLVRDGAEADAVRGRADGVAWLVVQLGHEAAPAGEPVLYLNVGRVGAELAARAVDQPDLLVWYEVVNRVRVVTSDGGPVAGDYSNVEFVVPDGHRVVAHAVRDGDGRPECLPEDAELVLPSHDLWALGPVRSTETCPACTGRYP